MIRVRRWLRELLVWGVTGAFLLGATGCQNLLTARLLNSPRNYCEPAPQPDLQIFQKSARLFFVRYSSVVEGSEKEAPSIFLLDADRPFENPHHPRFVDKSNLQGLEAIPVIGSGASSSAPVFAVTTPDSHSFLIHSGPETFGPFVLPTFETAGSRHRRLFLTPTAVIGDIVIVSSIAGFIILSIG